LELISGARSRFSVWLGSAAAIGIGLPILLWGALAPSAPVLQWFVPVFDGVAFVCMVVVALLGSLDAGLRESWRSIPVVFIACATAVMWLGHFAMFPGDIPALQGERFNQAAVILFLLINLTTPTLLSIALVQRGGLLARPKPYIFAAIAGGALFGFLVVAVAVAAGPLSPMISPTGEFSPQEALFGVAGLTPAVIGLLAYMAGLHGDERIAGGVLAALTFTVLNSISLLLLDARYAPMWYADHTLALLPFAALLAGQLWLYSRSVSAERSATSEVASAAQRQRIGLDVAEAMAKETDPLPVVDRLLSEVMHVLSADRVTMLRLVPGGFVVERSVDREGRPAHIGKVLPVESVTAGSRRIVAEALARKRPVRVGSYRVAGIDPDRVVRHAGIQRGLVMPLVRGGEVDSVLIVGRRTGTPFSQAEVRQLEEMGAIAALLIRNARLLADAESSSQAKSNFINLAAHELGTPIAVIRGYIEMLADETLGPMTSEQRGPMEAVRKTTGELADRVDQLLIASRLEAGVGHAFPARGQTTDIAAAVQDAIGRARDRARLIGADIHADVPEGKMMVNGSTWDIGIILDNLLNNAMTYSHPPARVRIEVVDGDSAQVKVSDSGIGIPEVAKDRVFEQFYRVDDVEFGYPSGTGLGLYISRGLAERCGGQLILERSEPGEGSVFTLRLKRHTA
jgi:signal transduction histidine kinase